MHETEDASLSGSYGELARLVGCESAEVARCVAELKRTNTADVIICNGDVTILCRRYRDELNSKEINKLRVQQHRQRVACNDDVTLHNKSNSNNKKKEREKEVGSDEPKPRAVTEKNPDDWIETLKKEPIYAHVDFDREVRKATLWIKDHPGRKLTKSFFKNWINKIEPPLKINLNASKPEMSEDERKMREGVLASQEAFYGRG